MAVALKKISYFIAYIVVVTAILLALSEASVRVFKLAPPLANRYGNMVSDPYLPFKPRPNSTISGRSRYDEFDYHVEINSAGFRDFERTYEKPEGVYRILGLGDSIAYGGAALFEDTYLRRVERMLNERPGNHPAVEIIKAGIPRYYPEPERILLEHYGIRYEPDVIVIEFGSSDVIDTLQGLDAITIHRPTGANSAGAGRTGRLGAFLYSHSHLARLILSYYRKRMNHRPANWDEIYKPDGQYEQQWEEIEAEFSKMAGIARTIGARMVILYVPDFTLFQRGEDKYYPPERLRAWARKNRVTFADVTPAMLKANVTATTPLYWPRDRHPTPAGYEVIARTLYETLIDNNLVP